MVQPVDEQETAALIEFMRRTSDLDQDKDASLRFLKAREGNLEKAEEMMRKSVKWRRENNISQYLNWKPPPQLENEFGLTYQVTGLDYEGVPVVWIPYGRYKSKECIQNGWKEEMRQLTFHILETVLKIARDNNRSQIVYLADCRNLSYSQVLHLESIKIMQANFQDLETHYPETVKSLIVINAPRIFSIIYKLAKQILSDYTKSKIEVYDSNKEVWMTNLLIKLPRESIPDEYLAE